MRVRSESERHVVVNYSMLDQNNVLVNVILYCLKSLRMNWDGLYLYRFYGWF